MKENLLVIPTRNSALMLERVLTELSHFDFCNHSILLVDNNSEDQSFECAQILMKSLPRLKDTNCIYIRNKENLGYGGSISLAFNYAKEHNFEWLWIIHSDDQTNWGEVMHRIAEMVSGSQFDVVLGSRFLDRKSTKSYNKKRLLGNQFFKFATRLLAGVQLSDPGAAVGAYRISSLSDVNFEDLNRGFHFHPELNLIIAHRRLKVGNFNLQWRDASVASRLPLIAYGVLLLKFLFRVWINRLLFKQSLEESVYIASKRGKVQT